MKRFCQAKEQLKRNQNQFDNYWAFLEDQRVRRTPPRLGRDPFSGGVEVPPTYGGIARAKQLEREVTALLKEMKRMRVLAETERRY